MTEAVDSDIKPDQTSSSETPELETAEKPPNGEDLEGKLQELEAAVKEKENKYLYLYAEFENFKKRALKERLDLMKYGWESVARELIQVLDNVDRALGHAPEATDKNFLSGLQMVQQQFRDTLGKQGVQRVEAEKKFFDPSLHEAIGQIPSDLPSGTVVKEETCGYVLHGRLLRPARVIISAGPPGGP